MVCGEETPIKHHQVRRASENSLLSVAVQQTSGSENDVTVKLKGSFDQP